MVTLLPVFLFANTFNTFSSTSTLSITGVGAIFAKLFYCQKRKSLTNKKDESSSYNHHGYDNASLPIKDNVPITLNDFRMSQDNPLVRAVFNRSALMSTKSAN